MDSGIAVRHPPSGIRHPSSAITRPQPHRSPTLLTAASKTDLMTSERELVLGTAGHIDHGKTALVRALTGVDTDRLPAEKQRGITIDLGFAPLDLGETRLSVVDVPGHERFIRNMLAGATGLDLALLVVAADDSVMPQTREHLLIMELLGIPAGVIAVTKCDLAEPDWIALVEADIRALVAGTFLQEAPIIRTSTVTGAGLDELRNALRDLVAGAPGRQDPGLFRLAIDRAFSVAGHGAVVTGTIASGQVAVGDELQWWPEGRTVRVRGLQHHDQPVPRLERGTRAALNLAGVRHNEIDRGQELATPGYLRARRCCPSPSARPRMRPGRSVIGAGTGCISERPTSGACSACSRRPKSFPEKRRWPRCSWPRRWWRSTASRSSSARRARPPRSEAAGCFSPVRAGNVAVRATSTIGSRNGSRPTRA